MKNKTIYIAGKVTDVPVDIRAAKFQRAEHMLQARGFITVNPIKLVENPHTPWQEAMDICIASLKECDAIYLLPCYEDSKGAMMELDIALNAGHKIYYELENVEDERATHDI